MLVSKALTDRLLDNARTATKESLEIRHNCRNTMCVSRILRHVAQKKEPRLPPVCSNLPKNVDLTVAGHTK